MNLIITLVMLGLLAGVVLGNPLGTAHKASIVGNKSVMERPGLDNVLKKLEHGIRKREISKAREDRNDMFAGKMLDKSFFMNDDVDLEWVAISEKVQGPKHYGKLENLPITDKTLKLSEEIRRKIEK